MVFAAVTLPVRPRRLERRDATYKDFENFVKLSQSFPQLDSPVDDLRAERQAARFAAPPWSTAPGRFRISRSWVGHVCPNAWTRSDGGDVFGRDSSSRRRDHLADQRQLAAPYDDRMLGALIEYAKANQRR